MLSGKNNRSTTLNMTFFKVYILAEINYSNSIKIWSSWVTIEIMMCLEDFIISVNEIMILFTVLSTHFLALALAANCFHDKLNTVHILFRVQKCIVSSERREIK